MAKQLILPFCTEPDPPAKWKFCRRCKKVKDIHCFQSLGSRHHSYCRKCVVARSTELRLMKRGRVGKFARIAAKTPKTKK